MDKIQIKCTHCSQKFAVTESYIGRMVECGACDEKFKVEGAALIRQKKHYPGEKSGSNASTFAKSHNPESTPNQEIGFQTANYEDVSAEYIQPLKPLQTLMIIVGALLILLFIIIFLLGGQEGGMLKGLNDSKRIILAAFITLVGSILILVGSKRRIKGFLLAIVLGASLMAMPFVFPQVLKTAYQENSAKDTTFGDSDTPPPEEDPFLVQLEAYKEGIGFAKVEASRAALSDPDSLKALVLRENKALYLDVILPYLQYSLGFDAAPVTYTFGREIKGQPVTLITFITDEPLEKVFELTKRFGDPQEMDDIRSKLKVIEVIVSDQALEGAPDGITNDPTHIDYFNANFLDLISIDRSKQLAAAKRLETSPEKGRQADISAALALLISNKDHQLSTQAISTLNKWTTPGYNTDQRVLDYAKEIVATDQMNRSVMDYLVDRKVAGSVEVLAKQWATTKGFLLWEDHLVRAKELGEQAIILALPTVTQTHYKSAASILNNIGTMKCIPALNAVLSKANAEDAKYLKAVIDEIKSRQ